MIKQEFRFKIEFYFFLEDRKFKAYAFKDNFPGYSGFGDSIEEALKNLSEDIITGEK